MLPRVTQRPRASLGRVLDDLGDTLLELIDGDPENPAAIDGIVIHDPVDEPHYPPHALVLGVAVTSADLARLSQDLGRRGVVGLVVWSPVALTPEIRAAVDRSGVTLLGLRRGATWAQLAVLLRSVLAEDDIGVGEPESLGGLPAGDLFAVANAVAALLDAPITIEDRSSRVLAFSGRQDEADASRVETIIGRQVPERYARTLTEHGVFRDLYREDKPVVVDPQEFAFDDITKQRVAIAVRAGDQVLRPPGCRQARRPAPAAGTGGCRRPAPTADRSRRDGVGGRSRRPGRPTPARAGRPARRHPGGRRARGPGPRRPRRAGSRGRARTAGGCLRGTPDLGRPGGRSRRGESR